MNSNYKQWEGNTAAPVERGQLAPVNMYGQEHTFPEIEHVRGQKQPQRWNDVFWGILFFAHIIVMVVVACVYIPQVSFDENNGRRNLMEAGQASMATALVTAQNTIDTHVFRNLEDNGDDSEIDAHGVAILVLLTVIGAITISILSLTFIIKFAEAFIKSSMIFNILLGAIVAIMGFVEGANDVGITGLIFFAFSAFYACLVWSRIPFAATNLVTASTAIKSNIGVSFFAYVAIVMNGLWLLFWFITSYSTIYIIGDCDEQGICANDVNPFVVFLLLLSAYWTMQVIKNVVHVTVAGTVGTWWWSPAEANSCCSVAITESNRRAMTYSFGSICLGSLLVAIVQTIKSLCESARDAEDGLCSCIAVCLLNCLETIMEMFNEWAFVYVGIYGYGFVDAAKNVITLFKARGWTAIITDYIVDRVLAMISFGVGLITGGLAALFAYVLRLEVAGAAFGIGFIVGFILTSILLGVVGSGVNTVVVCYAEDPKAFEDNHTELSIRMRESWRLAFPNDFHY